MKSKITFLALFLCFLSAPISSHAAEHTVTVTGQGVILATPDLLTLRIGFNQEGKELKALLSNNADKMTKVIATLKEHGIKAVDIQTAGLTVQPRIDYSKITSERTQGFVVANAVQATIRDISKAGAVVDAVVQSGANTVDSMIFGISTIEQLRDQARTLAVENARHKAELLAKAAKRVLGVATTIREGSNSDGITPMPRGEMRLMSESAETPVEGGTSEVNATVSVTFALGD